MAQGHKTGTGAAVAATRGRGGGAVALRPRGAAACATRPRRPRSAALGERGGKGGCARNGAPSRATQTDGWPPPATPCGTEGGGGGGRHLRNRRRRPLRVVVVGNGSDHRARPPSAPSSSPPRPCSASTAGDSRAMDVSERRQPRLMFDGHRGSRRLRAARVVPPPRAPASPDAGAVGIGGCASPCGNRERGGDRPPTEWEPPPPHAPLSPSPHWPSSSV